MDASPVLTEACEDRDFSEWHRGCAWCAVWAVWLDGADVAQVVQAGRSALLQALPGVLLSRYERQPHLTVAYRGLCQRGGHVAQEYGPEDVLRDVARLKALRQPSFAVAVGGFGSFTTVPYLAVSEGGAQLQRLHAALVPQPPAPGWRYLPHVTLGHYARSVPLRQVLEVLSVPELSAVHCRQPVRGLALVRYAAADIAGPLVVEGVWDLRSQRYQPASKALWPLQ